VPPRRTASIVVITASWPICPGRRIACACSCACASGFAAIASCHCRIFTNDCPHCAPWARRTLRLAQRLVALGMALGGRLGCSLGHQWDVAVSRKHLAAPAPPAACTALPTPTVLGVDDSPCGNATRMAPSWWIWSAASRSAPAGAHGPSQRSGSWEHPGVEVIARIGSNAYAEGLVKGRHRHAGRRPLSSPARISGKRWTGVPHAEPSARRVNALVASNPSCCPMGLWLSCAPTPSPGLPAARGAAPDTPAGAAYQIWTLHHQGWTAPAMRQQVGLSLRTVQRDLRPPRLQAQTAQRPGGQCANPYKPYLLERWNAGCYTALRLFRDPPPAGLCWGLCVVAAYAVVYGRRRSSRPGTAARDGLCQWSPRRRASP